LIFNVLGEGRSFSVFAEEVVDRFPGNVSALYDFYTLPSVDSVGKQKPLTEDLHRMNLDFDESMVRDAAPVNATESRSTWIPTYASGWFK
jgi:hypothetical protein